MRKRIEQGVEDTLKRVSRMVLFAMLIITEWLLRKRRGLT